jgi:hypothetical protein
MPLEPDAIVEVSDRFTTALSGRADRFYLAPPQPRSNARLLAAMLLDRKDEPDGDGPWQRAIAGGMRTVRLWDASPES